MTIIWTLFAAAVYLPDIGRGFVKDDFVWVAVGRDALGSPASIVRPDAPGFFRPIVATSFAVDYAFHRLNARAYGFTNFALYAACALLIALLAYQVGASPGAAAVAAFVWAVNPHGINMAVVWISGRTSLLLTAFSVAAALAFLGRRRAAGTLLVFAALLSKEEAVGLPIAIAALVVAAGNADRRGVAADLAAMAGALAAYLALRARTPALTPWTAPPWYRLTTDWHVVAGNVVSYADRAATIFVVVALLLALVCRARVALGGRERRLAIAGIIWTAAGFAVTVLIPVRSSLYAVFPSVGIALAAAVVVDAIRRAAPPVTFERRAVAVLLLVLLAIPLYRARNDRYVEPARVSDRTMAVLCGDVARLPPNGVIELIDEPTALSNFRSAFGALASAALELYTGRRVIAIVRTPDGRTLPDVDVSGAAVVARYQLTRGRIERLY